MNSNLANKNNNDTRKATRRLIKLNTRHLIVRVETSFIELANIEQKASVPTNAHSQFYLKY